MSTSCRQTGERALSGPPPFAGIEVPERRCSSPDCPVPGGAILSRYNRDPDGLCFSCRQANRLPAGVVSFAGIRAGADADHHEIAAALLLLQKNLHPGEPIDVGSALHSMGVEIAFDELAATMRWLRRRGFEIETKPGRGGYVLVSWRHPFTRERVSSAVEV